MEAFAGGLLGISAVIHFLPVSGVLGSGRLEALYGVAVTEPNTLLAMRHRAILFGVLGGLLVAAIIEPGLFWPAVIATGVADLAFLVLALGTDTSSRMKRVVIADVISLVALAGASVLALL